MKSSIQRLLALWLLAVAPSLASERASAAIVETDQYSAVSQSFYDADISSTDLLQTSAFGNITGTAPSVAGTLNGLRDGAGSPIENDLGLDLLRDVYFDGAAKFGTGSAKSNLLSNPTITITFNLNSATGGSVTGYDLSGIKSFYGWHDQPGFSDQKYTVSVAYVSAPTAFAVLYSVDYHPFSPDPSDTPVNPNASEISLTKLNVSAVVAVRFTFDPYTSGSTIQPGQLIREIDVFGVPSAAPKHSFWGSR